MSPWYVLWLRDQPFSHSGETGIYLRQIWHYLKKKKKGIIAYWRLKKKGLEAGKNNFNVKNSHIFIVISLLKIAVALFT